MITVFTPTYNRAYILPKLFESLKEQSSNNFEWIIVDDGSTDKTEFVVKKWIAEWHGFCIRYYKQENGGKHRAINKGVREARGTLFFIVDSDDYLTYDAIETLENWEKSVYKSGDKYCGVAGECACIKDGKIMGSSNKKEYVDATTLERKKYNILGDKAEAFYTKLLKKYPFPEIEGEKFITESVVWNRLAHDGYLVRWYNKPIYMCEYRPDGLTMQKEKIFAANPKGYAISVRERCEYCNASLKEKALEAYYFYENVKSMYSVKQAVFLLEFRKVYIWLVYAQILNAKLQRKLEAIKGHIDAGA